MIDLHRLFPTSGPSENEGNLGEQRSSEPMPAIQRLKRVVRTRPGNCSHTATDHLKCVRTTLLFHTSHRLSFCHTSLGLGFLSTATAPPFVESAATPPPAYDYHASFPLISRGTEPVGFILSVHRCPLTNFRTLPVPPTIFHRQSMSLQTAIQTSCLSRLTRTSLMMTTIGSQSPSMSEFSSCRCS